MNILVELIKTEPVNRVRVLRKGPVSFELETSVSEIGPSGSMSARVYRTGFHLGVTGSYDEALERDYYRMRKQALEMISKKLYGNINNMLREALYYLDNHDDPKVIRGLLCAALDETELKDEEGTPV